VVRIGPDLPHFNSAQHCGLVEAFIPPWASSPGSERCVVIIFGNCRCNIDCELQKEPEDIGQVLAALASDIQKRETQLNEIRLRERRSTLLVTMYTFAGWGAYLGLWYAQLLPQMSGHRPNSKVEKAVKGFPAILGPIMYVILPLLSAFHTNLAFLEFSLLVGSYSYGTIARGTQKVRGAAPVSHA